MTLPRLNDTRVRVFHPSEKFDDVLIAFSQWMSQHGFSFEGITSEQMLEAGSRDRLESDEDEQRVRETERLHDEYLVTRHARCEMFSQVIGAARLKFRRDPQLLKELKGFRLRSRSRRGASAGAAESKTPAAPAAPKLPTSTQAA